ncbi:hypothetical protein EDC01DRAFT_762409 [Geopyxis carbonaria]|nr:hypothetical protein EDC01DRAFT_762409 [Geopyxis carbonaria]
MSSPHSHSALGTNMPPPTNPRPPRPPSHQSQPPPSAPTFHNISPASSNPSDPFLHISHQSPVGLAVDASALNENLSPHDLAFFPLNRRQPTAQGIGNLAQEARSRAMDIDRILEEMERERMWMDSRDSAVAAGMSNAEAEAAATAAVNANGSEVRRDGNGLGPLVNGQIMASVGTVQRGDMPVPVPQVQRPGELRMAAPLPAASGVSLLQPSHRGNMEQMAAPLLTPLQTPPPTSHRSNVEHLAALLQTSSIAAPLPEPVTPPARHIPPVSGPAPEQWPGRGRHNSVSSYDTHPGEDHVRDRIVEVGPNGEIYITDTADEARELREIYNNGLVADAARVAQEEQAEQHIAAVDAEILTLEQRLALTTARLAELQAALDARRRSTGLPQQQQQQQQQDDSDILDDDTNYDDDDEPTLNPSLPPDNATAEFEEWMTSVETRLQRLEAYWASWAENMERRVYRLEEDGRRRERDGDGVSVSVHVNGGAVDARRPVRRSRCPAHGGGRNGANGGNGGNGGNGPNGPNGPNGENGGNDGGRGGRGGGRGGSIAQQMRDSVMRQMERRNAERRNA